MGAVSKKSPPTRRLPRPGRRRSARRRAPCGAARSTRRIPCIRPSGRSRCARGSAAGSRSQSRSRLPGPRGRRRGRETLGPVAAFLQKGAVQHRGLSGSGVAPYGADAVIFRESEPDGVPASHRRRIVSERLVHGAVAAPQRNLSKITRKQHENVANTHYKFTHFMLKWA